MSDLKAFKGLSLLTRVCVGALLAAACTIHLRGDEDQAVSSLPPIQDADPTEAELKRCRTITYEQKDRLTECRKLWAEKRRQLMAPSARSPDGPPRADSEVPPALKDQSRYPSGLFPSSPTQSER